jgi:hypothetical protein
MWICRSLGQMDEWMDGALYEELWEPVGLSWVLRKKLELTYSGRYLETTLSVVELMCWSLLVVDGCCKYATDPNLWQPRLSRLPGGEFKRVQESRLRLSSSSLNDPRIQMTIGGSLESPKTTVVPLVLHHTPVLGYINLPLSCCNALCRKGRPFRYFLM